MWASGLLTGAAAQTWFRLYLYQTAWPGAVHQVAGLRVRRQVRRRGRQHHRHPGVRDTNGSVIVTTTNTVPLSAVTAIEGYVTSNASTGQVELKLFTSPDSTTATETQTSAATQDTLGGNINQVRFGLSSGGPRRSPGGWATCRSVAGYIGPGAIVQQMACGAPTATGFTVISKPVGGTSLRLKVATDSGLTQNVIRKSRANPGPVRLR